MSLLRLLSTVFTTETGRLLREDDLSWRIGERPVLQKHEALDHGRVWKAEGFCAISSCGVRDSAVNVNDLVLSVISLMLVSFLDWLSYSL